MVGLLLIGAAVAIALLVAASVRLPSLSSTLLVAYLALVSNVALVTWGLSPFRAVTRPGLAGAEGVLLAGAVATWWLRGRPRLPITAARPAVRQIVFDPVTGLFLAVIALLLAYELVVALTAPPNNWDSLTYHLPRAAAWLHHGGIYWIENPPTPNFNEFPPLAEQQILFLFVATGKGALFALPQYVAQLAILVAVYAAARRLGSEARTAACSSLLFATFSFVALQATTAQNDLFAASFPVVAACLILGGSRLELALAGAAAGIGLGAKPTTALVLPVLVWLVILRGRRAAMVALAGGAIGFAAIGMWVYVLNLSHTGSPLGHGGWTDIGDTHHQSAALSTGIDVLYQLLDLAVFSDRLIRGLAIGGVVAAAATALYTLRRTRTRRALLTPALVAVPFLSPLLVIGAGFVVAFLTRSWGIPVRGHNGNVGPLNRIVADATLGPVGAVALLSVPLLTLTAYIRRRVDIRHLALACALPIFLVLLSPATYNFYLTRFVLVPAALTAPLLARLFGSRLATAAYLVVASLAVALVITQDPLRPLGGRYNTGSPWRLTQEQAAYLTDVPGVGDALVAYDKTVPPGVCVGAVLGGDEPAYLLSGPKLEHEVVYLTVDDPVSLAREKLLSYVVISAVPMGWAAGLFEKHGWDVQPLSGYWLLAVARRGPRPAGRCGG